MSSSGGGRNPGLAIFKKIHTWYYSLEHLDYRSFHSFGVLYGSKFFLNLENIFFLKEEQCYFDSADLCQWKGTGYLF